MCRRGTPTNNSSIVIENTSTIVATLCRLRIDRHCGRERALPPRCAVCSRHGRFRLTSKGFANKIENSKGRQAPGGRDKTTPCELREVVMNSCLLLTCGLKRFYSHSMKANFNSPQCCHVNWRHGGRNYSN